MNSQINPDDYSLRELFKMGYFKVPARPNPLPPRTEIFSPHTTITDSGRVSKRPNRFQDEQYAKGSGCCKRGRFDHTDMNY